MAPDSGPALPGGISVVVPTYFSPGTLPAICEQLDEHVRPLCTELEIIFVDDGSTDATWLTISTLALTYPWVRGLRLIRNFGQHNALLAGIRAAGHPYVLTIDDDLQNPPSEVPALVAAMTDEVDLVYGSPRREAQGALRNTASRLTKRAMASTLGPDVHPQSSGFRLFRRQLIDAGADVHDPFVSIDVMLTWATTRIAAVEVEFAPRAAGRSGYSFRRLLRHAINMITGYSTRPLRVVSVLGFGCAVLGFGLLTYVLVRFVLGQSSVAGFTFLAAAITLFSGVQLLSLGIVGEYLGRMHFRSMGRPAYIVRERTEPPAPGDPDGQTQ